MPDLFAHLDAGLQKAHPAIYSDLQPGTRLNFAVPGDLRRWFAWRNGQPSNSQQQLFETYSFVSYQVATAELSHMRSTLWKSPLNFALLLLLNRRVFYTLPILIDIAGDGYCYDLIRRRIYYRFKGERDLPIPDFDDFLSFLTNYVSQTSVASAHSVEDAFLRSFY